MTRIQLLNAINETLIDGKLHILSRPNNPYWDYAQTLKALDKALGLARQLPDIPKHRAIRAHIVAAREALNQ